MPGVDEVDSILEQWRRERPDVDVSAMSIIARVSQLERLISARLDVVFAGHDLESWEFDRGFDQCEADDG